MVEVARTTGWGKLEETVARVRAPQEALDKFNAAKNAMYDAGLIDLAKGVVPHLPDVTLEIVDEFDKAGGKGFPPSIRLIGPTIKDDKGVTRRTLYVYPDLEDPNFFSADIVERRSPRAEDITKESCGSSIWRFGAKEHTLPVTLLKGICVLSPLNCTSKQVVRICLGMTGSK